MAPAVNGYSDVRQTVATVSAEFPIEDLDAYVCGLQKQLDTLKKAFTSKINALETKCRELEAENKMLRLDKERLVEAAARAAPPAPAMPSKSFTFQLPLDDDVADPFKSSSMKPSAPPASSSLQPTSAVFVPAAAARATPMHKPERGPAPYRGRGRGPGSGSRTTSYTLVIPAPLIKQQTDQTKQQHPPTATAPIPVPMSTSSTNGVPKPPASSSPDATSTSNSTPGPNTPAHKDSTSAGRIEPLSTLTNNASYGPQNGTSVQLASDQLPDDKQHNSNVHMGYRPGRGRQGGYRGRGRPFHNYGAWPGSAVNA